jgi:hypothetical protein
MRLQNPGVPFPVDIRDLNADGGDGPPVNGQLQTKRLAVPGFLALNGMYLMEVVAHPPIRFWKVVSTG